MKKYKQPLYCIIKCPPLSWAKTMGAQSELFKGKGEITESYYRLCRVPDMRAYFTILNDASSFRFWTEEI
jgi:hypothetical protein